MSILEKNDEDGIAVESFDEYEVLYIFLNKEKIEKLEKLFARKRILLESRDMTEDTLRAVECGSEFTETFQDASYKKMLETFLRNYLTVDMILDKISEKGIESLTDLDKEILEKA
jgi:hypothetical protein